MSLADCPHFHLHVGNEKDQRGFSCSLFVFVIISSNVRLLISPFGGKFWFDSIFQKHLFFFMGTICPQTTRVIHDALNKCYFSPPLSIVYSLSSLDPLKLCNCGGWESGGGGWGSRLSAPSGRSTLTVLLFLLTIPPVTLPGRAHQQTHP